MTKIRDDKLPKDATTLTELENLFKTSKEQVLVLDEEVGYRDEIDDSGDDVKVRKSSDFDENENSEDEEVKPKVASKSSKRKVSPEDIFSDCDSDAADGRTEKQPSRKKVKTGVSPTKIKKDRSSVDLKLNDSEPPVRPKRLPPCDLPNVFSGVVIDSLPGDRRKYENLRRYFVAYGGRVGETGVTHRIGTTKDTTKVEWLIESVKRRRLVDERQFRNS